MIMTICHEYFPALDGHSCCRHAFLNRVPGLDVKRDRESALDSLAELHAAARLELGFGAQSFVTAEQVHGNEVAVVSEPATMFAGADGLVTNRADVCLGVY